MCCSAALATSRHRSGDSLVCLPHNNTAPSSRFWHLASHDVGIPYRKASS